MPNNLKQLIEGQIQQLETLQVQLDTELHLISAREPESLMKLVEEKAHNLDDIAQTDTQIKHLYQKTDDADLKAELEPLFDKAHALVEECKYRTEINQRAIEQGQLRLTHLKNLLLESRAKESMTYDKSGRPKGGMSGPSIEA
ncbi:flagellar protein FlgN [Aestuariibacter sp. AA17]|uniref:Flagellar protein FlgN n=1 Tax=Fluctibacter corallii TaxID=2984329 RepID=A0ABT3AA40_9ALTE|nr:flagellar protein FlgN [Aestuariibacter sp. AA17]MCV2885493.1 flagellar protein FlgN [Aestuariibacter sp. AA17]